MAKYQVAQNIQVVVGGVVYSSGDGLPADADSGELGQLEAAGWIQKVQTRRKKP